MAKRFLFGQDFTLTFYPIDDDGNAITADGLDSAYIFTDSNKPSRDDAQNGTNALQTIGSWSASGNGYELTVDGIDDPDPDSDVYQRQYWLAVNFTLSSSEQVQTSIVEIILARAVGYAEELNVVAADLEKFYPSIDGFISDSDQTQIISEATLQVKAALENKNWEFWMVKEPSKIRPAVIWRSLYLIALSEQSEGEGGFGTLLEEAKANYEDAMRSLSVRLDTNLDGEPDSKQSLGGYMRIIY